MGLTAAALILYMNLQLHLVKSGRFTLCGAVKPGIPNYIDSLASLDRFSVTETVRDAGLFVHTQVVIPQFMCCNRICTMLFTVMFLHITRARLAELQYLHDTGGGGGGGGEGEGERLRSS